MHRSGFTDGDLNSLIEQRFVGHNSVHFDATGSRDDQLGLCIIDATGQFMSGKTSEDHRVDHPNSGTGQHGNDGFRHHRHVDDDPVAFLNPLANQHSGKARHLIQQLTIAEGLDRSSDGAVVN